VNVASFVGKLALLKNRQETMELVTSPSLSISELVGVVDQFVSDVTSQDHEEKGWPSSCYGMSKLAVIAYTKILARDEHRGGGGNGKEEEEEKKEGESEGERSVISVSVCPGWCQTDMSSQSGVRTAEEGGRFCSSSFIFID